MRMYIPGRVCEVPGTAYSVGGQRHAAPIYASGTWLSSKEAKALGYKSPSLFVQATRGFPINQVLHTKVLSQRGKTVVSPNVSDGACNYAASDRHYYGTRYGSYIWQCWDANSSGTVRIHISVSTRRTGLEYRVTGVVAYIYAYVPKEVRQDGKVIVYQGTLCNNYTSSRGYGIWLGRQLNATGLPADNTISGISYDDFRSHSVDAVVEHVVDQVLDWAWDWSEFVMFWAAKGGPTTALSGKTCVGQPMPDVKSALMFNEYELQIEGIDPISLGRDMKSQGYWRNWLIQHAYVDALQSAPRLNDNSISNAMEVVSFIKTLVVERKVELPKKASDLWLSYRYAYTTSKLDAEEAIQFVKRTYGKDVFRRVMKAYGAAHTTVGDTPVTCRCCMELKSRELDTLDRVWNALYTYGLQPNFYVVWDMIPYSFIVDWFVPVGDMLSVLDTEANMMRGQYDITNVCFSLSYNTVMDGYNVHCYSRWASPPLSYLNEFYWFDKPKASSKVVMMRIADTASLIIG